jgi:hypothetical protein
MRRLLVDERDKPHGCVTRSSGCVQTGELEHGGYTRRVVVRAGSGACRIVVGANDNDASRSTGTRPLGFDVRHFRTVRREYLARRRVAEVGELGLDVSLRGP